MNEDDPTNDKTLNFKERDLRYGGSIRYVKRNRKGGQSTIATRQHLQFLIAYRMMKESQASSSTVQARLILHANKSLQETACCYRRQRSRHISRSPHFLSGIFLGRGNNLLVGGKTGDHDHSLGILGVQKKLWSWSSSGSWSP